MGILPKRLERFKSVISRRQLDLTVILENVHDPHNIGAVLRTCDSVGIAEIFVVYTDPRLRERGIEVGHKSSSGTRQWIDINYFESLSDCFGQVRSHYERIYCTRLDEQAVSLYDLDLTHSCALLFGNEHDGVTTEASQLVDANFVIPQVGFVNSLNISVACAVSLYEAFRQRKDMGLYDMEFGKRETDHSMMDKFTDIHRSKKLKGK